MVLFVKQDVVIVKLLEGLKKLSNTTAKSLSPER